MKQIAILDAEERLVFLDAGTIEECEDGIIVRLSCDCSVYDYSLKTRKGPISASIKDDQMFFDCSEPIECPKIEGSK